MSEALQEEWFDRLFEESPAAREGLPATYRMRHDAHYVERLAQPAVPQVQMIPVAHIDAAIPPGTRDQASLAASIARFGLLQPLLVRRRNGRYNLIAGARRLAAAVAAGLTEVPCLVHDADEQRANALREASNTHATREDAPAVRPPARVGMPAAALAEVTAHLDAIGSCLNLLAGGDRALRERVAVALIGAEVQRATWVARGLAVLTEDPVLARSAVNVAALLATIVDGMRAEHALTGLRVTTELREPVPRVLADERLISLAIGGSLVAVQAIARRVAPANIFCAIGTDAARGALFVEIGQRVVTLPASRLARFFDLSWTERPGGYAAGIGMLAARRVAELHAGKLEVSPADEGGCSLRLELPCEALS